MTPLTDADKAMLDRNMHEYLDKRSCTDIHRIAGMFELHTRAEIEASIVRLTGRGLVRYDERRGGYCTSRPPHEART